MTDLTQKHILDFVAFAAEEIGRAESGSPSSAAKLLDTIASYARRLARSEGLQTFGAFSETVEFNPARHESFEPLQVGQQVTIITPGILSAGETVKKASVTGTALCPQP